MSSVCLVLPGAGAGEPPSGRAALRSAGGAGGGTGGASGAGGGCRRSAGLSASPARGRVLQSAPRPRGAGEHADFSGEGQAGRTEVHTLADTRLTRYSGGTAAISVLMRFFHVVNHASLVVWRI